MASYNRSPVPAGRIPPPGVRTPSILPARQSTQAPVQANPTRISNRQITPEVLSAMARRRLGG